MVTGGIVSIEIGVILEVTLSTLVTNGAIQGMVGQDELHNSTTGNPGSLRGSIDSHGWSHLGAAWSNGLRSFLHFHQAHPTVSCYFQSFMIAESWNFDPIFFGCLKDGQIIINLREHSCTWYGFPFMNISIFFVENICPPISFWTKGSRDNIITNQI